MENLPKKYRRLRKTQQSRSLAFTCYNIAIALCLLAAVGLSHIDTRQREDAIQRRAQLLVDSLSAYECVEQNMIGC